FFVDRLPLPLWRRRCLLLRLLLVSRLLSSPALGLLLRGLARRRVVGARNRQERRELRQRLPDLPLAEAGAAPPPGAVRGHVILVIPVGARPQHRGEPGAYRGMEFLAQLPRGSPVGERHELAIAELDAAHVERIGAAMLGQLCADDAIAATAIERVEIVDLV